MSLSVLGSGVLMTLVTALAVYGATRARISSEPAMAILAAVTVVFLYDRYPRLTDSSKFGVEHSPDGADH